MDEKKGSPKLGTILHISCSPRGHESQSYAFSLRVIDRLLEGNPTTEVVRRELWSSPLPHMDADYGHILAQARVPDRNAYDRPSSLATSETLIVELERADAVVIATPMHNYTIPSIFKAWIDHVVRVERTFTSTAEGKLGFLADRPVHIVVASGGVYEGVGARQPDFLTPYLRAVFATIGIKQLYFYQLQRMIVDTRGTSQTSSAAEAFLDMHWPWASRERVDE